jgi:poly(hydroxyalkanoate) depolymerase family esterase
LKIDLRNLIPGDTLAAEPLSTPGRLSDAAGKLQQLLSVRLPIDLGAVRSMLPEALHGLPLHGIRQKPKSAAGGEQFLALTFANHAGSRPYKLFVPSSYSGRPVPLVVMLHGCTQSPDDFAAGTRMNAAAEARTFLVAYPAQTSHANMQKCWNWFNAGDQRRDSGEPSLIAGITRQVMSDYAVDPARVYVAGLSAGGAAAAIMGDAYPDLFAAIGVHSGLACGAATDMQSAFAAMQRGGGGMPRPGRRLTPAIVFHGGRDTTVNPRNGDAVVAQAERNSDLTIWVEAGQVSGGYAYDKTRYVDPDGKTVIEKWLVHGAGHAWFGGSSTGSYTDPKGPDATSEMLRFFLEHRHPAPS